MRIIKYCETKYNIATTATIQIGTLNYYRMSDNRFIADSHEGFGVHSFRSEDSEMIFPEEDITVLTQGRVIGARVAIKHGGKFTTAMWAPNVYIFSSSLAEEGTESFASQFGYDSFYEITDPDLFMRKVQEGLSRIARLRDPKPRIADVIHIHGPVRYQDAREHSHVELCSPSDLMVQNLFTKPLVSSTQPGVKYVENQEYRFVWVFLEETTKRILEVENDPILIRNIQAVRQACKY